LWLSVLRTVNGAEVRFMEVMTAISTMAIRTMPGSPMPPLTTALNKPAATLTMTGLTQNSPPDVLP
jgi:hypothetical protein